MPKTSHQHFSVALLSKVNDKNWHETKIWKTSCVSNLFPILAKKTNFDNHLWSWCTYPNPNRSKTPWLYFQVSTTLPPQPRFLNLFIFVLTKSLFKCLECLLLVGKSRKKYIEISTKNKQLLTTTPQSKHYTIEPKSLQSPNWIFLIPTF